MPRDERAGHAIARVRVVVERNMWKPCAGAHRGRPLRYLLREGVVRVAHESRGMEPAGVRRLVEAHYSDVYAYCRRHTESVDEAEDAVQEVFLRFVGASGRYRDDGRPLAYLLTIARNVCADSHRRGAMRADELPCDEVLADPSPGSGSADRLSAVRRAVRALPDEAREIVELKFDQGLTSVEIARVTGLSRFAVARRIGSALSDIREALASEEGDA